MLNTSTLSNGDWVVLNHTIEQLKTGLLGGMQFHTKSLDLNRKLSRLLQNATCKVQDAKKQETRDPVRLKYPHF